MPPLNYPRSVDAVSIVAYAYVSSYAVADIAVDEDHAAASASAIARFGAIAAVPTGTAAKTLMVCYC